jgi:tyrosinase
MNDQRFDQVTRLFGRATSRRHLLGGAAGLGGATLLAAGARRAVSAQDEPATPVASPVADGDLRVRKNAASLTADEKLNFVDAVLGLKKKPSPWVDGLTVYDTFVLWHRDAFGCAVMAAHMGPAFFPWHRQFVLLFEEQLRLIEPTVTVPYWDWTVDNTHDAAVWGDDLMGGNGDPAADYAVTTGPFRKGAWTINIFDYSDQQRLPFLVRQFGAGHLAPNLPTVEQLEVALSIPVYDVAPWNTMLTPGSSFRNALEGWQDCVSESCDPEDGHYPVCTGPHNFHNGVHLWIAGEYKLAHEGGRDHNPDGSPATDMVATPATDDDDAPNLFGTMAANSSLNDPVFWLHHANIDRIWNEWMRRHGQEYLPVSGGPIGHNLDDHMWPFSHIELMVTPRDVLDSTALGYRYDTDAVAGQS